jgi:hypothetical protein
MWSALSVRPGLIRTLRHEEALEWPDNLEGVSTLVLAYGSRE